MGLMHCRRRCMAAALLFGLVVAPHALADETSPPKSFFTERVTNCSFQGKSFTLTLTLDAIIHPAPLSTVGWARPELKGIECKSQEKRAALEDVLSKVQPVGGGIQPDLLIVVVGGKLPEMFVSSTDLKYMGRFAERPSAIYIDAVGQWKKLDGGAEPARYASFLNPALLLRCAGAQIEAQIPSDHLVDVRQITCHDSQPASAQSQPSMIAVMGLGELSFLDPSGKVVVDDSGWLALDYEIFRLIKRYVRE